MSYVMNTKVSVDYTHMGHSWRTGWLNCAELSPNLFDYPTILASFEQNFMLAMRLIHKRKEKLLFSLTPCQVFKP